MKISNKEAHEPKFWICIFVDTNYLTAEEKDGLFNQNSRTDNNLAGYFKICQGIIKA